MAVLASIYGKQEPEYVGCTLDTWEHNGYHDSYWYALVWDKESQELKQIEYDTTAAAGGGWAKIDATGEVLREVYRHYKKSVTDFFDSTENPERAKQIKKGDMVLIVKGRKVKKGTQAQVFWVGTRYNPYSRQNEERIGIEVDGERVFIAMENAELIGWQDRLLTGKDRKVAIRKATVNRMPVHYRRYFARGLA